eukprot:6171831-Pleurochrysis_carterae.AAC.5
MQSSFVDACLTSACTFCFSPSIGRRLSMRNAARDPAVGAWARPVRGRHRRDGACAAEGEG